MRAADHSPPSSTAVMEEYSYTSTHTVGHNGPVTESLYILPLYIYIYIYIWGQVVPQMRPGHYFKWGQDSTLREQDSTTNEARQYLKWRHKNSSYDASTVPQIRSSKYLTWGQDIISNDASTVPQMRSRQYFKWGKNSTSNKARVVPQMKPKQYLKWSQNCTSNEVWTLLQMSQEQ